MSYTGFDFPNTHFYESDLRELIRFYDELQNKYDGLVADIAELNEWRKQHEGEYAELLERLSVVEGEIDNFEAEVTQRFAELDAAIHADFEQLKADVTAELEQTIEEFRELYNQLKREIEIDMANLKYEINALTYELRQAITEFRVEMIEYLDERFDLFIQNLPDYEKLIVHNPVTGTDTTVQVALNDLYDSFNIFGITARQFDSLELTAYEFDNFGLTAHEFDTMSYKLLGYPDPTYYMRDPFTGEWALVSEVVLKLFGLHAGGLSAEEFDATELTCDEFDALDITTFYFDFYGLPA